MVKIITTDGTAVEAVVLDEGDKLKSFRLNPRTGTSWEANLLIEVVKHTCGAWPVEQYDEEGSQMFLLQDPQKVVERATEVVRLTIEALRENKWTVPLPTASELVDNGGRVGFTRGEAANGKSEE